MRRGRYFRLMAATCALGVLPACQAEPASGLVSASPGSAEGSQVDRPWPPELPKDWRLGEVVGVDVGNGGDVYVLHRPGSLPESDQGFAAPPVVVFDREGGFVRSFGGPSPEYEWPRTEHSLSVDALGRVWLSGNYREDAEESDDMILVFDARGRFLRQFGRRGQSTGNLDRNNFGAPGDIFVDVGNRETYVADGYINQRLIVIDSESGRFKRMWTTFGREPEAVLQKPVPSKAGGMPDFPGFYQVHGVEVSDDGRVYVSDRLNQRVQVFTRSGEFIGQFAVGEGGQSPVTASGMVLSGDPDQKYLAIADFGAGRVLIYDRESMELISRVEQEFEGPHLMASDSEGTIYVAEVQGRRITRLRNVFAAVGERAPGE